MCEKKFFSPKKLDFFEMRRAGLLYLAPQNLWAPKFKSKPKNPDDEGDLELECRIVKWILDVLDDIVVPSAKVTSVCRWADVATKTRVVARVTMEIVSVVVTVVTMEILEVSVALVTAPPTPCWRLSRNYNDNPSKAAATKQQCTPPKKKKKKKPQKPRNLCWDWQQSGECPVERRYGHCNYIHDLEWKGKGGRGAE
jgi:hypothetical protein